MAVEMSFESAMTRLEKIVADLEGGRCSLDESLKLFEEGTKLTNFCNKTLNVAEQKIKKITASDVEGSESEGASAETVKKGAELLDEMLSSKANEGVGPREEIEIL